MTALRPVRRSGRRETREERADRRWNDLLQEVRVAQTGAQIMFGFLLGVAFTPRFRELNGFDHALYLTAVTLGAVATGTLIAPVAFHRLLAGRRVKPAMVRSAARLVCLGLGLLALAVCASLLLLYRVAGAGAAAAGLAAGALLAWIGITWLVLPLGLLRQRRGRARGRRPRRKP
ncbi:DUF6328 family protein [Streptacidiphilus monticola]|uniref:DUF6328 family protein n=1 Tax=Streptacidiphilus monticola TaxID=2161674 RepID=A0ABW1G2C7_9ACTN